MNVNSFSQYKNSQIFFHYKPQYQQKKMIVKFAIGALVSSVFMYLGYEWNKERKIQMISQETDALPLHYEQVKALKNKWDHSTPSDDPVRELFSRASEIKKVYKDTHYVFIHAQTTELTPIIYLMQEVAKKNRTTRSQFYKYIRMPLKDQSEARISSLKEDVLYKAKNGQDYNILVRKCLISVDAYFNNQEEYESAYYFLKSNDSGTLSDKLFKEAAYDVLDQRTLNDEKLSILFNKLNDIGASITEKSSCGNLWVFCVPKGLINDPQVSDVAYRSHAFGRECDCHQAAVYKIFSSLSKMNNIRILQELQEDHLNKSTECRHDLLYNKVPTPPQYRLFLPDLTPEKKVLSFMLTTLNKDQRKEIKEQVKACVSLIDENE